MAGMDAREPHARMRALLCVLLKPRGDAEVVHEKGVNVGCLLELLGGAAGAVARLCVDADDDRIIAGLRSL